MNIFGIFKKKSAVPEAAESRIDLGNLRKRAEYIEINVLPHLCGEDWLRLYRNIPEIAWAVNYIASRIAGANFVVRKYADDTIVWGNAQGIGKYVNSILVNANSLMSFREIVFQHFVYRLCTGNAYMRAAMAETFEKSSKYQWCSNFWELPADKVNIVSPSSKVPMFGIADKSEIVKGYELEINGHITPIPEWQVWHDRDGLPQYHLGIAYRDAKYLKSVSRLSALRKPISNLLAVYEARNVIYVKRGGLGFITNMKKDDTGNVALSPKEKQELLDQHFNTYGIGEGKYPIGFSNTPIQFVRTNMSIQDLQPFDETLMDAISIAGAFEIPSVLVPRKDQSTFSNQATAEKSVYSSAVIPMAKQFCKDFSAFLGIEEKGYYIDCDFAGVDCMQSGMKEAEEVKQKVNERCRVQFENGIITLNDWRAQIGESTREDIELFSKLKYEMTDDELAAIERVTNFTNTKPVEDGTVQEPSVQD